MKVIHISKSDTGGGGAYLAAYRIHSALRGINVDSIMWVDHKHTSDSNVHEQRSLLITKIYNNFKSYPGRAIFKILGMSKRGSHSLSLMPSNWVNKINNSDADIVNLHWIQREMISIKDISKIKKPIVWTLHDMWAFCGTEHLATDDRWRDGYQQTQKNTFFDIERWNWMRKRKLWKNKLQIITPSRWLGNCVNDSKLMCDWPISVIGNAINTKKWRPRNIFHARSKFSFEKNKLIILFGAKGGTVNPNKGFDLLIKSLDHVMAKTSRKNIELIIFGQNKPGKSIDLPIKTRYLGYLKDEDDLIDLYNSANVTVVPSRMESFGLTALESLACGTPVVSFQTSGLIDIVEHKTTGYLAEPYNVMDFGNGITWVLENDKDLFSKCIEKVRDKFSYTQIANEYESIYSKVLNNKDISNV